MRELIIALGLFFFIEGILYALFPSKMKNMVEKIKTIKENQLRIGGLVFAVIGFLIIWYMKRYGQFKVLKLITATFIFINFSIFGNAKDVPSSFADLAEKLMPSVVNISTTQTVTTNKNPFPFQFPPGSTF